VLNESEFAALLSLEHESQGVEFKPPGPRTNARLFAVLVRAVLGMANRRDGGLVVIGVEETAQGLDRKGLTDSDLVTWKFDDVATGISEFADPSIEFELTVRPLNDKKFVLLEVSEFEDIPVICKRDFDQILRRGALYVRSRRKPETTESLSQAEMRDLLDIATEKRLRRFLATANRVGLPVPSQTAVTDEAAFLQELAGFP
jgi:predicted HTH transcriptional regulator